MEKNSSASEQTNAATELITSGRISSAVWYLAWPTAIQTLLQTAYMVANMVFVGRLAHADRALAAVGIGNSVLMIQFGLMIALSVGTSALVARSLGAGRVGEADEATGQSLGMCLIGGVLCAAPLIIWARPIVELIGAGGSVVAMSADYIVVISWATVPAFIWTIVTSALRSAGDVRSPLYISAVTLALNVFLDWILIWGVGGMPSYGVHGAALATVIARVFGAGLSLVFLGRSVLRKSFGNLVPDWSMSVRVLKIGLPAAAGNLLWGLSGTAFIAVLALLPEAQRTAAQAALTVGMRIESFAFMPGLAYSMAATPLVGQNLGAGKPERAEHSAWVAVSHAAGIMSVVAVCFLVFPVWITTLFTTEAVVVTMTVSYLRINAVSEPFLAVLMVLRGGLQGAGDTVMPMIMTLVNMWVLRIPLAILLLKMGYGASGAWFAMSATTILGSLMIAAWFKWGTWRTREV